MTHCFISFDIASKTKSRLHNTSSLVNLSTLKPDFDSSSARWASFSGCSPSR